MSIQPNVTTEIRDRVFFIGLNRPKKLNAFNLAMLRELSRAYSDYEENKQLFCAVLFAHGDNFTAGLDLVEVGTSIAGGQNLFLEGGIDPLGIIGPNRTKPVVCAVQGWCLTIGVELLLASDIRIADKDARFSQMEVGRGIMPFGGATIRLPQIAGWGNAMYHLLTGDKFDAKEAFRIGLIQEIVEPGAHLDRATELAQQIASQAPLAVQASLASARTAVTQGEPAAIESLMDKAVSLMKTEDAAEGMISFVERREACFKGK